MAVNLVLGAPGSGKSYEAVAFHVLPALAQGRKVITNLSLNVEALTALDDTYSALIELRKNTRAVRPVFDAAKAQGLYQKFGIAAKSDYFNMAAFSHVEDYGDPWRHPVSGVGPLYVIDECHLALPSRSTPVPVEEWFSLHRHESADVLLISQSHRKVNRAVIDLVQTMYKVRKNTVLGSDKSYRRAVFDGVAGEQANMTIRKYQPHFFKFYSSYTRGGSAEAAVSDVTPMWKRPVFIMMFVSILIAVVMVARAGNPLAFGKLDAAAPVPLAEKGTKALPAARAKVEVVEVPPAAATLLHIDKHPLASLQVHQVGEMLNGEKWTGYYRVSRQGAVLFDLPSSRLVELGYTVVRLAKCFSQVRHVSGWSQQVTCDAPTQSTGLAASSSMAGSGEGPAQAGGATGPATTAPPASIASPPAAPPVVRS